MKDLGKLQFFLGVEVAHSREGINLCHSKYVTNLSNEVGMLSSKPLDTPIDPNTMHLLE